MKTAMIFLKLRFKYWIIIVFVYKNLVRSFIPVVSNGDTAVKNGQSTNRICYLRLGFEPVITWSPKCSLL